MFSEVTKQVTNRFQFVTSVTSVTSMALDSSRRFLIDSGAMCNQSPHMEITLAALGFIVDVILLIFGGIVLSQTRKLPDAIFFVFGMVFIAGMLAGDLYDLLALLDY